MTETRFRELMNYGGAMQRTTADPLQVDFWTGYMRGLRRAHHGRSFGTDAEHEQWLALRGDANEARDMQGRGYRRGIRDGIGCTQTGVNDCEECSLVSYGKDCRNMPLYSVAGCSAAHSGTQAAVIQGMGFDPVALGGKVLGGNVFKPDAVTGHLGKCARCGCEGAPWISGAGRHLCSKHQDDY